MNLNKLPFKKFITLQRGFDLPVTEMEDGEVSVLGSTGIIGYHNKSKVNPPGVITGRSGTIGVVQYIDKPYWPHNTSLWVKDFKSNYPKFVYYKMKTIDFERFNGGASVPTLNRNNLDNLVVQIPDEIIQQKIASILSTYDCLIDINHRRIHLLEEAARLLFREWFVYFRFPHSAGSGQAGHEKVKIVDGVPEGWEKIPLKEIISTVESGGRPKGGAIEKGIPSIGAENVNGIGKYDYSSEKYVPEEYYQNMKKGKVISKDVLLYKDGANIGRVSIVGHGFPHNKCCVNEHVFILRTKNNIQNWLYFFLSQEFMQQAVANLNSNSAQPGISQEKLSGLKIIFPDIKIVRAFDDTAEDIVRQIFTLSIQNQKLAQARDLLLPRLMSGAIEA